MILPAIWAWIEAVFFENVLNGGAADTGDAKLIEFAKDARVAPAVLFGQSNDKGSNLFGRARTTLGSGRFLGLSSSSRCHRRNVAYTTMEMMFLSEGPSSLPNFNSCLRSGAVVRISFGSLARRISFSAFRN